MMMKVETTETEEAQQPERVVTELSLEEQAMNHECCFMGSEVEPYECKQKARFWVGHDDDDFVYACGDHVEPLK